MRASRGIAIVQVEIQDILALVVGYGMAALLFRAFWPIHPVWSSLALPGAGLYLWLGLAMSGPIIILRRRRSQQPARSREPASEHVIERLPRLQNARGRTSETTWAERAWFLIGAYWIVLGIFIIPAQLHEFKVGDVLLFGLAPVVVAIGLRLLGPNRFEPAGRAARVDTPRSHRALSELAGGLDLSDRFGTIDAVAG